VFPLHKVDIAKVEEIREKLLIATPKHLITNERSLSEGTGADTPTTLLLTNNEITFRNNNCKSGYKTKKSPSIQKKAIEVSKFDFK